jgi:AcrR family transcriptional regulator
MSEPDRLIDRLPPGRHGLSAELVAENQRRRLMLAATESLAARGYGALTTTEVVKLAGVSTATFYKRFDDLWDCLQAAHKAGAERLCERIESACAAAGGGSKGALAGIEGGLALLASDPALAHLLSTEPPQIDALRAARGSFIARLAALLGDAREGESTGGGANAREREVQLAGGALALVSTRIRTEGAGGLEELTPTLAAILLGR